MQAIFDKNLSWVWKDKKTPELEKHEVLHLKLAERIASKGTIEFAKLRGVGAATKAIQFMAANAAKALAKLNLEKNHAAFLEKLKALDEAVRGAYDGETMNGMLPMPQEDWNYNWQAKIDAILLKLGSSRNLVARTA